MKKILLIEDDPFLSEIYITKFEQVGYATEVAEDGEAGVQKAKSSKPDIILLDIVLPKMNGLEVLTALKEDNTTKNIPVVILSNLGADDDVNRALEIGATNYLIKSQYTPSEVVSRIEELLSRA